MPRNPRIDVVGYYHVINRGINRDNIFLCDDDKCKFLDILSAAKKNYHFTVHSFCIMDNHYHLLIETQRNNLSLLMRYVNSQYACYFNKKMQRSGHLWQGRFKSWYVTSDNYLWLLIRYIEMNPVVAKMCPVGGEYPFSSSYCLLHGAQGELLHSSLLAEKDLLAWLVPLKQDELNELRQFEKSKLVKHDDDYILCTKLPLPDYFCSADFKMQRNWSIYRAISDGYKQSEIATLLHLSTAAVSRIAAIERAKHDLYHKIKQKGLLWSYDHDTEYDVQKSQLLVETVLKYSSLEDVEMVFRLYGHRFVKMVWQGRLLNDLRFKRLNYFLARVFFNMDVEANYFAEHKGSRADKLRLLAG
ncbi:MAG: transposase [Desulfuromonas sp.]|nr:transposase [Desulfuromonas sp.]